MKDSEHTPVNQAVSASEAADIATATYLYKLGNDLKDQGKLDDAMACFQRAVEHDPHYAEAYNNLGNAYKFRNDLKQAAFYYQRALHARPQHTQAHYNLGILFGEIGRYQDAIACYRQAVLCDPQFVDAHFNLANSLREVGKLDEAIQCYEKALAINPAYTCAYNGLGTVYEEQGKLDKAFTCFQKHLRLETDAGIEVKASLLVPVISESKQSIVDCRRAMICRIENLSLKNLHLNDPVKQIGKTNFFLAYHGLDNKNLQKKIADFYLQSCPELEWQPALRQISGGHDGRIKVGIISRYLRKHTMGYLNYGIIQHFNRQAFHITVFGFPGLSDDLSTAIAEAADNSIILPAQLWEARQIIAQQDLDILLYLDIGMDPLTYFLAFARLAPVQCTTWGHPDTTGIPNMDYYISSAIAEPHGARAHYTEKLILFDQFPMYCRRPETPAPRLTRAHLDLPANSHVYACIQSLFKVHPDFDDMLAGILRQDPAGIIVFFEGKHAHWGKLLRKRFARRLPDARDRVRFLERLPQNDFQAFLQIPDVILDTPHFSGGYTSLLALAMGTPIVTLPGEFMRGRLTYAWYKQMGVMDAVADDIDTYVDIACKLAGDRNRREALRHEIKAQAACLYDNLAPTRELEHFFQWASNQAVKARY